MALKKVGKRVDKWVDKRVELMVGVMDVKKVVKMVAV